MRRGFITTVYVLVLFLIVVGVIVLLSLYGKNIITTLLGWMEMASKGIRPG